MAVPQRMYLALGFTATANEPVALGSYNPAQNYILNIPTRLPHPWRWERDFVPKRR